LVGLKRWETLVAKPPIVDKLLDNMSSELGEALQATTNVISDADLSPMLSDADRHTALGYQAKGVEFLKLKAEGKHVSALLLAPQVLHRKPLTLPMGSRFSILHNGVREKIEFTGDNSFVNILFEFSMPLTFVCKTQKVSVVPPTRTSPSTSSTMAWTSRSQWMTPMPSPELALPLAHARPSPRTKT